MLMTNSLAWLKLGLKFLLGVFMIFAGVRHFTHPDFYLQLMPPYIPAHKLMVDLSGVAEIVLGIGLLVPVPRVSQLSAWGIIALLIAIFPANIHVFLNRAEIFPDVPDALHFIRLPLQGIFILWAWWFTRPSGNEALHAASNPGAS
jgi:uncharacterized membrane protein